jgi:hypothetical protein
MIQFVRMRELEITVTVVLEYCKGGIIDAHNGNRSVEIFKTGWMTSHAEDRARSVVRHCSDPQTGTTLSGHVLTMTIKVRSESSLIQRKHGAISITVLYCKNIVVADTTYRQTWHHTQTVDP